MDISRLRINKKPHMIAFWAGLIIIAIGLLAFAILKSTPAIATSTGGSGGSFDWRTDVSYSNGTTSSTYHIDASKIDPSKPIGLVVTLHGDGGCDYYASSMPSYCGSEPFALGGANGIRKTAQDYNLISVTPLAPLSANGKHRWWQKPVEYANYLHDLIDHVYGQYNIDTSRVWFTGFSGGSDFLSEDFFPMFGGTGQFTGGGILIFSGGMKPASQAALQGLRDHPFSQDMKQNYRMWWGAGTADLPSDRDPGWMGGYAAAKESEAYYKNYGFQNTGSYYPEGWCHSNDDAPGCDSFEQKFGYYLRLQLQAAYDVTPDTTAPTVSITSPSDGATVDGSVAIKANASDNVGVTKVEFYRGSTKLGEDSSSPYQYTWDSTGVSNGSYELTAKAYDAAGNSKTSSKVGVSVSNADTSIVPVTDIKLDGSRFKTLPYFVKKDYVIGQLEHNSSQSVSFSLQCDPAGSDDALFRIDGNKLVAKSDLAYNKNKLSFKVCVRATDTRSNHVDKTITLSLKAPSSPVAVADDKTLKPQDKVSLPIRPTFSGTAEPGSIVHVEVHSDPVICETTAGLDGKWSCTLPKDLEPGNHTVYIKVTLPNGVGEQNLGPFQVRVSGTNTDPKNVSGVITPGARDSDGVLPPNSGIAPSILSSASAWIIACGLTLVSTLCFAVRRHLKAARLVK